MANEVRLTAFPSNAQEALALLYVQSQDLKGKAPSEIQTMYYEALYQLRKDHAEKSSSGWFREQEEWRQFRL